MVQGAAPDGNFTDSGVVAAGFSLGKLKLVAAGKTDLSSRAAFPAAKVQAMLAIEVRRNYSFL